MATSRTARSPLKQIDFLTLAVLADGPLHGYGVVQAIDETTGGTVRLRPGDVYRVLYRLHGQELIVPADPDSGDDADERRSYYRITDRGQRALRAQAELLAGVADRVLAGGGGGGK